MRTLHERDGKCVIYNTISNISIELMLPSQRGGMARGEGRDLVIPRRAATLPMPDVSFPASHRVRPPVHIRRILASTAMLAVALCPQFARAQAAGTFVVRDVRLFDGERVTEHRSVVVRDGVIADVGGAELAVPAGARVVEGRGRTLMPGFIDAHVHLSDSTDADLRQALAFGVTTVLDMFSGGERYERIEALRSADAPDMADVRTAGIGASVPGGHPSQMGGPPIPTITD
jgi:hypothetical protein